MDIIPELIRTALPGALILTAGSIALMAIGRVAELGLTRVCITGVFSASAAMWRLWLGVPQARRRLRHGSELSGSEVERLVLRLGKYDSWAERNVRDFRKGRKTFARLMLDPNRVKKELDEVFTSRSMRELRSDQWLFGALSSNEHLRQVGIVNCFVNPDSMLDDSEMWSVVRWAMVKGSDRDRRLVIYHAPRVVRSHERAVEMMSLCRQAGMADEKSEVMSRFRELATAP